MAGALTLIVLVAAGDSGDATTRAIARTTRVALGPDARVEVREARADPSDGEALGVAPPGDGPPARREQRTMD
jgi:hypothetical protein